MSTSITPTAVSSAIFNQIRNGFNGVIMGELRGNLSGMIGAIPSATKKVLNQNVIISAKNLMTQVKGNEVDFLGDGKVKV